MAMTREQHADKLRAIAEWFTDCKNLTLENLPVGLIDALHAGADALIGSGTPPPSAERADSTSRSAAKKTSIKSVPVSLDGIETIDDAKEAVDHELFALCLACAGKTYPPEGPICDRFEAAINHLIQVVQAHAAQLQEKKELVSRSDQSGSSIADPRDDPSGDSILRLREANQQMRDFIKGAKR